MSIAPTRSAVTPPEPVAVPLVWTRSSSGRTPAEDDTRPFVLLLADGAYLIGRRRTLKRVVRAAGPEFVKASSAPGVPLLVTAFVDAAGQPVDGVVAWAGIDGP
jgi:hypothetical protein